MADEGEDQLRQPFSASGLDGKAFHSEEFLQGIFGTGAANPAFLDPAVRKVGARRRVVDKDLAELQFMEAAADYAGIMAE